MERAGPLGCLEGEPLSFVASFARWEGDCDEPAPKVPLLSFHRRQKTSVNPLSGEVGGVDRAWPVTQLACGRARPVKSRLVVERQLARRGGASGVSPGPTRTRAYILVPSG